MKTRLSYARAARSRVPRLPPRRTSGITRGPSRDKGWLRERGSPEQHERMADMDATLSLLDAIDLLRIDVHRTAHYIYSDIDEP
jgi:hypothetical protein